MNILVTGCNGFIAREYIKQYQSNHHFVGVDTTPSLNNLYCETEYNIDICDTKKIEKIIYHHNIECIVHTAAEKSLINCEINKNLAKKVNLDATIELAKLSNKYKIKFIFISSDQVFDGKKEYSKESDITNPINYYGKLKATAESFLINLSDCAICRTALVFGDIPEEQLQYFDKVKYNSILTVQGFIVQHVKFCLENKRKIILPYDEYMSPTHVSLLADQIEHVITNDATGIFHCCGKERISRYNMGLCIAETYGLNKKFIQHEKGTDKLRPKDVSLDCKYTEQILQMDFLTIKQMLEKYMPEI